MNSTSRGLRSQEKQALKIVRFQRHLPLTIQFYISCRISGVPPLQSDFSGLSSALRDDTIEPKKRKETRTKPTKMARKKSTLRMTRTTTDTLPTYNFCYTLATATKSQSRGSRHGPHATRSCPMSNREGGYRRPGVASPRRSRALARCTQHECTVYHRRVSSKGSSSKKPSLIKLKVSFAMKPCLSNARAPGMVATAVR